MTTEKELEKIHIKDAIKENTVVHCETEKEAERILGMAHELGYKWWTGKSYKNNTEWYIYKSKMCYDLLEGSYSDYYYFKNKNYTIIPSTQIEDSEEAKSSDWTPAPEEIEEMKSNIFDKNGIEVCVGDTVVFPYIDPMGRLTEDEDFKKQIVFKHGCFGYETQTSFEPLMNWMKKERGDYVPNCGNKVVYTEKYPFWVERQ
ncbi:MAG: hypothetical protein WCY37_05040 [Candidatus Dojkabacteria bacterium]